MNRRDTSLILAGVLVGALGSIAWSMRPALQIGQPPHHEVMQMNDGAMFAITSERLAAIGAASTGMYLSVMRPTNAAGRRNLALTRYRIPRSARQSVDGPVQLAFTPQNAGEASQSDAWSLTMPTGVRAIVSATGARTMMGFRMPATVAVVVSVDKPAGVKRANATTAKAGSSGG